MCATYAPRDPIGEFWRGELSLRSLRVLIDGLPPDSALHRKYPESAGWTQDTHVLASLIDSVAVLTELTRAANSEDGKFNMPERFPRPLQQAQLAAARAADEKAAEASRRWFRKHIEGR